MISSNSTEVMLGSSDIFQGDIVGRSAAGNTAVADLLAGDGVFAGSDDLIGGPT